MKKRRDDTWGGTAGDTAGDTAGTTDTMETSSQRPSREGKREAKQEQPEYDEDNEAFAAFEQNEVSRLNSTSRGMRIKVLKSKGGTSETTRKRVECNCQAVDHALVANCTACGKIVCAAEGEGECFFCGSFVTSTGTVPAPEFIETMRADEVWWSCVPRAHLSSSSGTR
jgi:hypothetical protein